jgi:DNA-directed RNA polymerase specialized sigma24 family protein
MMVALAEAGAFDGLVRRLQSQWRRLDEAGVRDAVGDATASLYEAVKAGKPVNHPIPWMFKVAMRRAAHYTPGPFHDSIDDPDKDAANQADAVRAGLAADGEGPDEMDDARRRTICGRLRSLAARLGPTQRRVMEFVLDQVAAGYEDVPTAAIAEALVLEENNAAVALHRGRRSLQRLAIDDGLLRGDVAFLDQEE